MTCEQARALLPGWVDRDAGGLTDDERVSLEAHLDTCDACRRRRDGYAQTAGWLRALPSGELPWYLRAQALERGSRAVGGLARRPSRKTTAPGDPVGMDLPDEWPMFGLKPSALEPVSTMPPDIAQPASPLAERPREPESRWFRRAVIASVLLALGLLAWFTLR